MTPMRESTAEPTIRAWRCGPLTVAVDSNDAGSVQWLAEALEPWFGRSEEPPDWCIRINSSARAYAELSGRYVEEGDRQPCFVFDQWVLSLATWPSGDRVVIADTKRSCFLIVGAGRVEVIGDPRTRRWRMTSLWALHEILAIRLRRTHLDLHAASVEVGGRTLLLSGHKEAGKTTLSLYLLSSGSCRAIANDRAFVGGAGQWFDVIGIPTVVKIRPPTVAAFPDLSRGIARVERPYLHTVDELAAAADEPGPEPQELALTPAQILRQLAVAAAGPAVLGAMVFPEVRAEANGWSIERLVPSEVGAALWRNLYGNPEERGVATIFTAIEGLPPPPSREMAGAISAMVPGYRLVLGRNAYDDRELARQLVELAHRS